MAAPVAAVPTVSTPQALKDRVKTSKGKHFILETPQWLESFDSGEYRLQ